MLSNLRNEFIQLAVWLSLVVSIACVKSKSNALMQPVGIQAQTSDTNQQLEVNSAPLKLPLIKPYIIVSKGKRQLALYSDDKLVRVYQIGLGFNPKSDKIKEGDGATPEGEFYIYTKNEKSAYYLSLGLSYPNAGDAERGLRDKLITPDEHRQIIQAIASKTAPPQNTKLGGQIYIHGRGASRDWTWGCVALEDTNIKELFDAVPINTKVTINP